MSGPSDVSVNAARRWVGAALAGRPDCDWSTARAISLRSNGIAEKTRVSQKAERTKNIDVISKIRFDLIGRRGRQHKREPQKAASKF
jgi:hypothetical protein